MSKLGGIVGGCIAVHEFCHDYVPPKTITLPQVFTHTFTYAGYIASGIFTGAALGMTYPITMLTFGTMCYKMGYTNNNICNDKETDDAANN